jgi:ribokinase
VRCAAVGHCEWIELVLVDAVPAAGQIAHGEEAWSGPAGAGSVIAAVLARLSGACDFFTALGDDHLGHLSVERLTELGVTVHAQWFGATRRALTHVDAGGERTITTVGPKLRSHGPLPLDGYDAIFFVAGDPEALRSARAARFLAATPRELETLLAGDVHLDLLVGSGTDRHERYEGGLDVDLVVRTDGVRGGYAGDLHYEAAPLQTPVVDTYGAGDTFGGALCFALARGDELDDALAFAAGESAAVVAVRGPYPQR